MTPWKGIRVDFPSIPTMITHEERRYLYWLGEHAWQGLGHIVEIGPWLGGSTTCLAAGMRSSERSTQYRLHVFDNFLWRDFMSNRAALPLTHGESFQGYFESNIAGYRDLVAIHRQALPDEEIERDAFAVKTRARQDEGIPVLRWDSEEPVEILFIDGAKSWSGLRYLLKVFSDRLIPGTSLLVCQDYKYWGSYWVPIIFELIMNNLQLHHNITENTVTFKLISKIPQQKLEELGEMSDLGLGRGMDLLDTASRRLADINDPLGAAILQSCKVRFLWHNGDVDSAVAMFRRLESEWPLKLDGSTIDRMREWLCQSLGQPLPASWYWKLGVLPRALIRLIRRFATARI